MHLPFLETKRGTKQQPCANVPGRVDDCVYSSLLRPRRRFTPCGVHYCTRRAPFPTMFPTVKYSCRDRRFPTVLPTLPEIRRLDVTGLNMITETLAALLSSDSGLILV